MESHSLYCRGIVPSVRHDKEFWDNVSPEPISNWSAQVGGTIQNSCLCIADSGVSYVEEGSEGDWCRRWERIWPPVSQSVEPIKLLRNVNLTLRRCYSLRMHFLVSCQDLAKMIWSFSQVCIILYEVPLVHLCACVSDVAGFDNLESVTKNSH